MNILQELQEFAAFSGISIEILSNPSGLSSSEDQQNWVALVARLEIDLGHILQDWKEDILLGAERGVTQGQARRQSIQQNFERALQHLVHLSKLGMSTDISRVRSDLIRFSVAYETYLTRRVKILTELGELSVVELQHALSGDPS